MAAAFVGKCGVPRSGVVICLDPADPREFGERLTEESSRADDVFILYYVGHGLVSSGGELYLATASTTDAGDSVGYTALAYAQVRTILLRCQARTVVVVLDCCFSGRADGVLGAAVADAYGSTFIRGTYLLASAAPEEAALALPGEPYTAFSGALIRLLTDGDERGPARITLSYAYEHLCRVLPPAGVPRPHRQAGGLGDRLVLAPNPAYVPQGDGVEGSVGETAGDGDVCPYQGLEPFGDGDADLFFGREELTERLLRAVAEHVGGTEPLAVLGPSGVGKSSLLRAGLVPAARNGRLRIPGSHRWPVVVMSPGESPLRALARALRGVTGRPVGELTEALSEGSDSLGALVRQSLRRRGLDARLVLVVDQLEELFTVAESGGERDRFIRTIIGGGHDVTVILGIRTDFYSRCVAYPELAPALERQLLVGPMDSHSLRLAIERPAAVTGLTVEAGLVDRLLEDLNAGATDPVGAPSLPLLSYALQETWRQRRGRTLTLAGYQATGGIWSAVAQRAELAYEELGEGHGEAGKAAARTFLLSLVHAGDGTDDTRRRIRLSDLVLGRSAAEKQALQAARDAFVGPKTRLVTVDGEYAEIAHEALVRAWPRLHAWVDRDRTGLLAHQRLTEAAALWERKRFHPDALSRGTLLADARAVTENPARPLTALERSFVEASDAARLSEEAAARRRTRLLRQLVSILGVLLLAAVVSVVVALRSAAAERRITAVATSRQLTAQAELLRDDRPEASLRLSVEAIERDPKNRTARTGLIRSLLQTRHDGILTGHIRGVSGLAYHPGGGLLASAGSDGSVMLWDNATRARVAVIGQPDAETGGKAEVVFGGAEVLVAISNQHADGTIIRNRSGLSPRPVNQVTLWNIATPQDPEVLSALPVQGRPARLAASRDGKILLVGEDDFRISAWDIGNPRHPSHLGDVHTLHDGLAGLVLMPDGRAFAVSDRDGDVELWSMPRDGDSQLLSRIPHSPDSQSGIAVCNADGRTLLTYAGGSGSAELRDVTDPRRPGPAALLAGHTGAVFDLACGPDGRMLVSAASDGLVKLWDIGTPASPVHLADLRGHRDAVANLAFAPDGNSVASGGNDTTIRLWRTRTGAPSLVAPLPRSVEWATFVGPGDEMLLAGNSTDAAQVLAIGNTGAVTMVKTPDTKRPPGGAYGVYQGTIAAMQSADGTATTLWDFSDPTAPRPLTDLPHVARIGRWDRALFAPDGRTLTLYGGNLREGFIAGKFDLTDLRHPRLIGAVDGVKLPASVTRDGRTMATDDSDVAMLYDITDTLRPRWIGGKEKTRGGGQRIVIAPNGTFLVTAGDDSIVRIWHIGENHKINLAARLYGHTGTVLAMTINASGTLLVTAGTDRSAILWDISDPGQPEQLARINTNSMLSSAQLRRDGGRLILGSHDAAPTVWDTSALTAIHANPVALACPLLGPPFTNEDKQRYLADTQPIDVCA